MVRRLETSTVAFNVSNIHIRIIRIIARASSVNSLDLSKIRGDEELGRQA